MANRALQAKALKLQKQNAARPYLLNLQVITESDTPRPFKGVKAATKKPEKVSNKTDIRFLTSEGKGPWRSPIFNATNWEPETRLIRKGKVIR
jgi:hypothetical protein